MTLLSNLKPTQKVNKCLCIPCKKIGRIAKWQVCWKGPVTVERRLNDTNYVVQKTTKSKPVIVHADRMRKLFQSMDIGSNDPHTHTAFSQLHCESDSEPQHTRTSRVKRLSFLSQPTRQTHIQTVWRRLRRHTQLRQVTDRLHCR